MSSSNDEDERYNQDVIIPLKIIGLEDTIRNMKTDYMEEIAEKDSEIELLTNQVEGVFLNDVICSDHRLSSF
jgi:hypothetical protein